jgi:phosphatidylinositol alpha-1,6-mannosyltransferase
VDTDTFYPKNDIEPDKLKKYDIPDPAKHFIILTLGRLSLPDALYKGYDRLISVFSNISNDYPEAHLVIAGRGNYRAELEKKVADLNLTDKVSFTGSIEEQDLPSVYQSCKVFSLITASGEGKGEGIPLTPLEAMACGKPIIVGNQDGSREAIVCENGYSIDPNALDEHEKLLRNYIDDVDLLNSHSHAALRVVQENFSYEHFFKRHKVLLEKVGHD